MNVYINYQFNLGNALHAAPNLPQNPLTDLLLQQLQHLINNVSAAALKETLFKLLMEYLLQHAHTPAQELQQIYTLLDFLKVMAQVQAHGLEG